VIAAVEPLYLLGSSTGGPAALRALQDLGCLHLELPPATPAQAEARRALAFLRAAPLQRHAAGDDEPCDIDGVLHRAGAIETRLQAIDEARRALARRLQLLQPWGEHRLDPDLPALGLRLWFYEVPEHRLAEIPAGLTAWQVVGRDHRSCHVAVLHADEPRGMPVPRVHTGSRPRAELRAADDALAAEADDLQAERCLLTRWLPRITQGLAQRADAQARAQASALADAAAAGVPGDAADAAVWVLPAWAPTAARPTLDGLARQQGLVIARRRPLPDDSAPTLLVNTGAARHGQRLLGLYTVPAADGRDPSAWLWGSFVLFFGMVLGDLGYGLALAIGLLAWQPRSAARRDLREMFLWLAASGMLFGAATGTMFGRATPPPLDRLVLVDGADVEGMMALALLVGVGHVMLGALLAAARLRGPARAGACGWVLVVGGTALAAWGSGAAASSSAAPLAAGAWSLAGLGAVLALGSALAGGQGWQRIGGLLEAVMRAPAALGDVLSYLRLFALAYAGAALASAFNALAGTVADWPGFGALLAALLLVFGHGLNLLLSIVGGFVHGLRLNFIEFFRWAAIDEGRPFRPFQKTDAPTWTPHSSSSLA
jgi:V/A-type H+-transporting ATPase subunit I